MRAAILSFHKHTDESLSCPCNPLRIARILRRQIPLRMANILRRRSAAQGDASYYPILPSTFLRFLILRPRLWSQGLESRYGALDPGLTLGMCCKTALIHPAWLLYRVRKGSFCTCKHALGSAAPETRAKGPEALWTPQLLPRFWLRGVGGAADGLGYGRALPCPHQEDDPPGPPMAAALLDCDFQLIGGFLCFRT